MAYLAMLVVIATFLSAVTLVRMIREDGRGPAPPPRSHHGDGSPRPWWTDGAAPEEPPAGPRILLVDKSPAPRRS